MDEGGGGRRDQQDEAEGAVEEYHPVDEDVSPTAGKSEMVLTRVQRLIALRILHGRQPVKPKVAQMLP